MTKTPSKNASGASSTQDHPRATPRVDHTVEFKVGAVYQLMERERLCLSVHHNDAFTLQEINRFPKLFYFSFDLQERYQSFCSDFGPVNLGILHRFCNDMHSKYTDPRLLRRTMVYYTDEDAAVRTNAAFLLGTYMVLFHGRSPAKAWHPFSLIKPRPWLGFRDATYSPPTYTISLLDCFEAVFKAVQLGWYDVSDFDLEEYEYWEHPLNGDLHQVCPKFIAFKGPSGRRQLLSPGLYSFQPKHYFEVFKDRGVTAVVRLNEEDTYDRADFENAGFHFMDLYFDDCTVPSADIIEAFLNLCDAETGVIAVHCKAGLGRTGTLIALWMMKNHGWKADPAIAWLRIVRPGCVIGPQQKFLKICEQIVWQGNRPTWPEHLSHMTTVRDADEAARLATQVEHAMNLRGADRINAQDR